jgi:hypothetical protein
MWETLNKCWNGDEELAWGGGTSIENEHDEFFTPPESPKRCELEPPKVDHNPKINNVFSLPKLSTYLEVNSYSHAIVVEQLMNLIRTPKQVSTSNQLKV